MYWHQKAFCTVIYLSRESKDWHEKWKSKIKVRKHHLIFFFVTLVTLQSHWPQRFIQVNYLIHRHLYLNIRSLSFLSQKSVNRILTGHRMAQSTYPVHQPLNETILCVTKSFLIIEQLSALNKWFTGTLCDVSIRNTASDTQGNPSWQQAKRSVWELDEPGHGLHL